MVCYYVSFNQSLNLQNCQHQLGFDFIIFLFKGPNVQYIYCLIAQAVARMCKQSFR